MIPYRTKAAMKILMGLTKEEALKLSGVVDDVQKKFYIGNDVFPFDHMKKEDAVVNMKEMLKDEELDIPVHLRGHLERFLELMINERVPMDRLISEYNSAFTPVLRYGLFELEAPEKPIDKPDTPLLGTIDPKEGTGDKLDKESERRMILSDIADEIVDSLMEQDMTFCEMLSVIDTAHAHLKAERALYRRRLDNTPIRGLWAMEERGQQEDG